jgi:signal transduction histidine kinase
MTRPYPSISAPTFPQRSIRLRLTLWYGGVFLALGAVLLVVNYALVDAALPGDRERLREQVAENLGVDPDSFRPERGLRAGGGADLLGFAELIDQAGAEVESDLLNDILLRSGVALASIGLISIVVGWFLAGRQLRPIRQVTRAARRISNDNLHERVALAGPHDELRELGDQFDSMLERLEHAFAAQREFAANASHELRTPLTIIGTELEVTLSQSAPSREELAETQRVVRTALQRAEDVIARLLLLAQAEAGVGPYERMDLREQARAALQDRRPEIERIRLRLATSLESAPLRGDPHLLPRLVDNLIANAINHNVPDGTIDVRTESKADGVALQVENTGTLIPADRVAGLFDRFARLDPSRSRATGGVGLGLAIVRSIAHAHGGQVSAQPRPGGGLIVDVLLPAQSHAAGPKPQPSSGVEPRTVPVAWDGIPNPSRSQPH